MPRNPTRSGMGMMPDHRADDPDQLEARLESANDRPGWRRAHRAGRCESKACFAAAADTPTVAAMNAGPSQPAEPRGAEAADRDDAEEHR